MECDRSSRIDELPAAIHDLYSRYGWGITEVPKQMYGEYSSHHTHFHDEPSSCVADVPYRSLYETRDGWKDFPKYRYFYNERSKEPGGRL